MAVARESAKTQRSCHGALRRPRQDPERGGLVARRVPPARRCWSSTSPRKCGLTPQYTSLEELQKRYGDRGFSVVGFPCNQFGAQEPGTAEEIQTFCSTNYGVTFPLFEKIDVNGDTRHPLYAELTSVADAEGNAGDIQWNFEKFVVSPSGNVVARFRPQTVPDDPAVIGTIEANLPA